MENTGTIEANERRYDTATGTVLDVASAPLLRSSGRNIDGFFRPRTTTTPRVAPSKHVQDSIASMVPSAPEIRKVLSVGSKPRATHSSASRSVNHTRAHTPQAAKTRVIHVSHDAASTQQLTVRRGQPNHVHHHATQHSQTLRRDSVPTPKPSTHNLLRPNGHLQHESPSLIAHKQSAENIDIERLARAQNAAKSPLVARHATASPTVLPTFASLAVQQPSPGPTAPPVVPPPTPDNGSLPPAPAPQTDNKPVDIFTHAIANANNFVDPETHKAHYRKKARTHVVSMLAGSLALIVIATFIAYQNSPAMQLKVASVKAGISAHMPNFAAAGFAYNGVRAGDSRIIFGFRGTGGTTYQLTQTNTDFNDADMIQAIGSANANGTPTYQVVMADGTMVYRFSNTNATWVSDGEWYTVNGRGALTDQQVKSIVQHV